MAAAASGSFRGLTTCRQVGYARDTWRRAPSGWLRSLALVVASASALVVAFAVSGAVWLLIPIVALVVAGIVYTVGYAQGVMLGAPATDDAPALITGPGSSFVGTVGRSSSGTEPVMGSAAAAYTVLLHDEEGVRCHESRSYGFHLLLDDGTEIVIRPGPIRLQSTPSLGHDASRGERAGYLDQRGHLRDRAGDLGSGEGRVWVLALVPGDRIELLAQVERIPEPGPQAYRGTASIRRVVGIPLVTLLDRGTGN